MSDRCGWWVGGEWGGGVGCVGHGWLWPAISNHGGSWLFMARHEQPLSQSGQNQTQAFKAPKPNGDISEKSHIVSHSPTVLSHRETSEHFCNIL